MGERLRAVSLAAVITAGGALNGWLLDHVNTPDGLHQTPQGEQGWDLGYVTQWRDQDAIALADKRLEYHADNTRLLEDGNVEAACLGAVAPYRTGGEFESVADDGAVLDLITGEDQPTPCGTDSQYVRSVITYYRSWDKTLADAETVVAARQADVDRYQEYVNDDADFSGMKMGTVIGLVFGSVVSLARMRKHRVAAKTAAANEAPAGPSPEKPKLPIRMRAVRHRVAEPRPAGGGPRPTPRARKASTTN